jgi:hypothetical protein
MSAQSILDADKSDHRHEDAGGGQREEDVQISDEGGHVVTPCSMTSSCPHRFEMGLISVKAGTNSSGGAEKAEIAIIDRSAMAG